MSIHPITHTLCALLASLTTAICQTPAIAAPNPNDTGLETGGDRDDFAGRQVNAAPNKSTVNRASPAKVTDRDGRLKKETTRKYTDGTASVVISKDTTGDGIINYATQTETAPNNTETVWIWEDTDGDGIFDEEEKIITHPNGSTHAIWTIFDKQKKEPSKL